MVTERVRTLPTEPMEGEITKSNPLVSFINIGQRGRIFTPNLQQNISSSIINLVTCPVM